MPKQLQEDLYRKVKILNETTWEFRANRPSIDRWLSNFTDEKEKLHALYLLSQFMYFGDLQMRELLKCLYRDLYRYPVVEKIRRNNSDTLDQKFIDSELAISRSKTRFLGIGNPSESGTHLLYFFRQENQLGKDLFINSHEVIYVENGVMKLRDPTIEHYVFIDDFCGTGSQASVYSREIVKNILDINPSIEVSYLMLFTTVAGRDNVKNKTLFKNVAAVVELDESFRYFHPNSRYFKNISNLIDKDFLQKLCESHGERLYKSIYSSSGVSEPLLSLAASRDRLGYKDSQLLLGFHHNTPDNTLPIIWYDEKHVEWTPVFKRYNKI